MCVDSTRENFPSIQYTNKGLPEIGYTCTKITFVPSESQAPEFQAKYDDPYYGYLSDIDVHLLHF